MRGGHTRGHFRRTAWPVMVSLPVLRTQYFTSLGSPDAPRAFRVMGSNSHGRPVVASPVNSTVTVRLTSTGFRCRGLRFQAAGFAVEPEGLAHEIVHRRQCITETEHRERHDAELHRQAAVGLDQVLRNRFMLENRALLDLRHDRERVVRRR